MEMKLFDAGLNHVTIRAGQKVETSLISCCSKVSRAMHLLSATFVELLGGSGENKRGAGHAANSLTATPGSVRFTLSGRRSVAKAKRQKKLKLFETRRVHKHVKKDYSFCQLIPTRMCTFVRSGSADYRVKESQGAHG